MEVTANILKPSFIWCSVLDILNSSIIGNYCLASKLFAGQEIIEQVNVHLVSRALNNYLSWTYEQVKYINVHLASTNHEQVKYRNVHLVSRTTEQDKYRNVHLVSRSHDQVKYINVHLVSRGHGQVKYINVHLVSRSHDQVKYRNAHLVLRTTEQIKYRDVLNLYWNIWYLSKLWKDSRDRMVVRFTTTGAINAYHY